MYTYVNEKVIKKNINDYFVRKKIIRDQIKKMN